MHDEGSAKKLEAEFQKHWERLAIGVVMVAAVVYLGARFAVGNPPEEAAVDEMDRAIQAARDGRNPNIPAPGTFNKSFVSAQIAAFRPSAFTAGPSIDGNPPVERPQPDPIIFVIPTVKLESATPSFEGVDLVWSLTDVKSGGLARGHHLVDPKTFYFQVERKGKEGPWIVIESQLRFKENKDLKYRDTHTQPKTEYEYRVTLGADDSKWIVTNPNGLASKPSEIVGAHTPGLFLYKFDNLLRYDDKDLPKSATAYVTITKHDPVAGEVSITYTHSEGQRIGWTIDDNGLWTSIHRVHSIKLNRKVEVDFHSGAVLKKIAPGIPVKYKYQACRIKHTKDGPICEGTKPTEGTYLVNEAMILEEGNNLVVVRRPSGAGPKSDQLCPGHAGAPPPTRKD
jgi:hypothetical protein